MKAILEFNLPEETQEFDLACKASQLSSTIKDLDSYIRSLRMNGHVLDNADEALDQIHMELWALVNQYSVQDLV